MRRDFQMKNNHLLGLFKIKNSEEHTTPGNTNAKYLKNPNKFSQKQAGSLHHFIKNEVNDILEELHNEHNQKQASSNKIEHDMDELSYSADDELSSCSSDEELDLVSSNNESSSSESNDEYQLILSCNESEDDILLKDNIEINKHKVQINPYYFSFNKESVQTNDEPQDEEIDYRLI